MERVSYKPFMVLGVVLMLFGIGALVVPPAAAGTLVFIISGLLFVAGGSQLVRLVERRAFRREPLSTLVSLLAIATGVVMLVFPLGAIIGLATLVLGYLVASGIVKLTASALMVGVPGRLWTFLGGAVSLALAALVAAGLPGAALTLLGVMVGVDLLFTGSALVRFALALRSHARRHPHRLQFDSRLSVA